MLINNIDKTPPEDFTPTISNVTINGFKITANAVDNESGIKSYEYHIGEEVYETTQGEYEINNLNSGTEYDIYVVVTDKAGNSKQSETIQQYTLDEIVDYETYINEHMQVDKIIYINSETGNDTTGNGTNENPYATLDKIADSGIIENGYSYGVVLEDGTYTLTNKMFNLTCNKSINIIGNKEKTILSVTTIYPNQGGGSTNYSVNLYRLIWDGNNNRNSNTISLHTEINFYSVVFNNIASNGYSYFNGYKMTLNNCTITKEANKMLRTTAGPIKLTNCYGGFTSGYGTSDSDWDYQTNRILSSYILGSDYSITEDESVWKDVGTGTDPDGSQADLGVYGGEYSWAY